jgi:hypothetical protein
MTEPSEWGELDPVSSGDPPAEFHIGQTVSPRTAHIRKLKLLKDLASKAGESSGDPIHIDHSVQSGVYLGMEAPWKDLSGFAPVQQEEAGPSAKNPGLGPSVNDHAAHGAHLPFSIFLKWTEDLPDEIGVKFHVVIQEQKKLSAGQLCPEISGCGEPWRRLLPVKETEAGWDPLPDLSFIPLSVIDDHDLSGKMGLCLQRLETSE